ncbi:MAG: STAS domain-containing protein [Deltaproteobacteria bacterium]|nr:STAS domain-containing protein [Deltaproteobacteria bacterium]
MEIRLEKTEGLCRLGIEGEMTIYNALDIKKALLETLDGPARLEIDLSGVSELDTSGLQLLVLAKKEAKLLGKELRITAHSQATSAVFELYNMCD